MSKKEQEGEVIDFSSVKKSFKDARKFFGSHQKALSIIWVVVLVLVVAMTAFEYRVGPWNLDITETWATQAVEGSLKNDIANQIVQQFPTLPQNQLQQRVDEQFALMLQEGDNMQYFEEQVALTADNFKSRLQDEQGNTYLLAIDPYLWWRLTRNLIENGHTGEFIGADGYPSTNFVLAPSETRTSYSFHIWYQATAFKVLSPILGLDMDDLPAVLFFTPVVFMMLSSILAFFIGRRLIGNFGGVMAGLVLALHPAVLQRTVAGFSDTDAYNVFFPLLIAYLLMHAVASKNWKLSILFAALAAVVFRVYMWTWAGYLFIAYIAGSALVLTLAIEVILALMKTRDLKEIVKKTSTTLSATAVMGVLSVAFIGLERGILSIITTITGQASSFAAIKDATRNALWPNVYTTVAELNPATSSQVVRAMGGRFLFVVSIVGLLLLTYYYWRTRKQGKFNVFPLILGAVWFAATFYAALKGSRFTLLMAPIFAIGIGLFCGTLVKLVGDLLKNNKDINYKWMTTILSVLLLSTLFMPLFVVSSDSAQSIVKRADTINSNQVPSFNDAWHSALTKIRDESQEDAIISSWWDFGHQFITVGNRGATADGGSQNTPQAHWLGRLLAEDDELKSIGILRMLHCDANNAFDKINEAENADFLSAMSILDALLGVSTTDARTVLTDAGYDEATVASILESTHCIPPEAFIITSEDMVAKSGVWAHFGKWNFERAALWNVVKDNTLLDALPILQADFGLSESEARTRYAELKGFDESDAQRWISPYPGYFSPQSIGCNDAGNDTYVCSTSLDLGVQQGAQFVLRNVVIDIANDNATLEVLALVNGQQTGAVSSQPVAMTVFDDSGSRRITYADGQQFELVFSPVTQRMLLSSPDLAGSVFTRLFYFDGVGTDYFTQFDTRQQITGQRIYTYTVDWDAYLAEFQ